MPEFSDILYGAIRLPDWLSPFLRIPEFARLRGVRLSNVDSYQFKDLAGPCRWEHCVAVAWLAMRCADRRRMTDRDRMHLVLAALLHDVATPPFAHTAEYVLEGFDHEVECQRLLSSRSDDDFVVNTPVFAEQLPRFRTICDQLAKRAKVAIDPDEVAQMVVGDGEYGFMIHGSIDLDNADNVTRACRYMGIPVDQTVPVRVAEWLASQNTPPSDLQAVTEPAVMSWLQYRGELYGRFYDAGDEELGRQAFLQHLMRRSIRAGMSRRSLIWNTDERLLFQMEILKEQGRSIHQPSIAELVQRYRLLESPEKIAHISLDDAESMQVIGLPQTVALIEDHLASESFQPFAIVIKARSAARRTPTTLFPPSPGALILFKLGGPLRGIHLPDWMRESHRIKSDRNDPVPPHHLEAILRPRISEWCATRPWSVPAPQRQTSIVSNLSSFGNWSFRLSRNDTLHPYPGTFVHAIPSGLITSLGLQGDVLIDPFGGTGQTAAEGIRHGCRAITGDVNEIACLTARARLTYLSVAARERLRAVSLADLRAATPARLPCIDRCEKWFHPDTLAELAAVRGYIDRRRDPAARTFLLAAFSAIVTSCTARFGKEHGYFADNTPLEKGESAPPKRGAFVLFLERLERNLLAVERMYAQFDRNGVQVEQALSRAQVVKANVRSATPADYGIEERSAGAIITSPPYLCMADYALGQRLSYQLLFPDQLEADYAAEIGSRRQRFQKGRALVAYRESLSQFAMLSRRLLRRGGFLATVLGTPTATDFQELDFTAELDLALTTAGFDRLWQTWRPIHWHRNHGYARLNQERIAVHIIRD